VEGNIGLRIRDQRGGGTLAERRIIAMPSPVKWNHVTEALAGPAETAERRLEEKGLRMDAATALQLRMLQTAPLALLFGFGAIKWVVGTMRDRPVGNLTMLLVFTLIAAAVRFAIMDHRTNSGKRALRQARGAADRLRRAAPSNEAALAVALFGTTVLAGSYLSDFHRLRRAGSGDGGSGGGDGSSGCGGGGCGGCGS